MLDPISVPEAARILKLSPARVRILASQGQLPATKIGGRWVVELGAVEQRRQEKPPEGRRFTPQNAWAAIDPRLWRRPATRPGGPLAPEESAAARRPARSRTSPSGPSRGRSIRSHPGEIPYVFEDEALMRSGISAARLRGFRFISGKRGRWLCGGVGLGTSSAATLYLRWWQEMPTGTCDCGSFPMTSGSNLDLSDRSIAPKAAVALDLAGERDARSQAAGKELLRDIDRENQKNLKRRR